MFKLKSFIWSDKAIDYSKGIIIMDYLTKTIYSNEEALKQPKEVKSRLINYPVKIGCFVVEEWVRI